MNFKEMEEHSDHFVFHTPHGHKVQIAKKGLSQSMLKRVQSFAKGGEVKVPVSQEEAQKVAQGMQAATLGGAPKKMADGGEVPDPTMGLMDEVNATNVPRGTQEMPVEVPMQDTQRDLASMTGWDQAKALAGWVGDKAKAAYDAVDSSQLGHTLLTGGAASQPSGPTGKPNLQVQPAVMQGEQAPTFKRVNLGEGQNVPRGTQMEIPIFNPMQALNQLQGGIQKEAQTQGQLGQQQAGLYEQEANKYQTLMANYEQQQKHLNDEYEAIKQDYATGQINPNRYFENRGTFGNIRTALGMILGGIGAGLTGGENPALKFINAQINRDIESQKANLGKKENLLSANLRQYGNIRDAMTATRMAYTGMMEAQINKLAAQSKNPLEQARAQQALAKLQLELGPEVQQMAFRQATFQGIQNGQGIKPAMAVRSLVPKERQAEAAKELGKFEESEKLRKSLINSFHDLSNQVLAGTFSPEDRNSAIQAYAGLLAKVTEGRFNLEESKQQIRAIMPSRFESQATRNKKLERLNSLISSNVSTPTLDEFQIPLQRSENIRPINAGPGFQKASMVK